MRNGIRTAVGWVALGGPILALVLWAVANTTDQGADEHAGRTAFLFGAAGLSFTIGLLALSVWLVLAAVSREHLALLAEIRSLRSSIAETGERREPGTGPTHSGPPPTD